MATFSERDLGLWYGLNSSQSKTKITNLPEVNGNINNAKVKYPDLYGYLKFKGWSDARFLNLSCGSAAHNDAVWSGQYQLWGQPCMSRVNITWPEGDYWMNYPAAKCMGRYIGKGPHLGWNPTQAATCLHVWKQEWLGDDAHEMCSMMSTSYGLDGSAGWLHAGFVDAFGFVGNNSGWYDPTYTESGIVFWDEAEASNIGCIWSDSHNGYGAKVIRGTPHTWTGVISAFTNSLGGVGLFDGELGTVSLGTVSGDDNPALIVMESKYGRGAGGNVNVKLLKSESGKRNPNKGQIALWQRSPCVGTINVGTCQADMNGPFIDSPFVMNSRAWGQTLNVGGFVGWNMRTYVHDVTNKRRWAGASYNPMVFVWCSRNGGTFSDLVTLQQVPGTVVNATDRLGMVPNNGNFDYVNGTPAYSLTGGAVTPPPVDPPPPASPNLDRTGWTITASSTDGTNTASKAIDGSQTSFWMSGTGMTTTSPVLTIDMKANKTFKGITFSPLPGYNNSYPRSFTVEARVAGSPQWVKLDPALGPFIGAFSSVATFAPTTAQYIRITCRTANANWFNICDLQVQAG